MKIKYIVVPLIIAVFGMGGFFLSPAAAADTYSVDTTHSYVIFRIKHLGVGYSFGRINGVKGSFSFDDAAPEKGAFDIQVPADGADTNQDKRDKHIKSADFFDAAKYPVISFKSKSVKALGKDVFEVSGDLNFHGKTRPLTVKASHTGSGKDPWGSYRKGFEAAFSIKRTDFGIDFMLNGLSDEVLITVSIEGIRK